MYEKQLYTFRHRNLRYSDLELTNRSQFNKYAHLQQRSSPDQHRIPKRVEASALSLAHNPGGELGTGIQVPIGI